MGVVCCNHKDSSERASSDLIIMQEEPEYSASTSHAERSTSSNHVNAIIPVYAFCTHEAKDKGKVSLPRMEKSMKPHREDNKVIITIPEEVNLEKEIQSRRENSSSEGSNKSGELHKMRASLKSTGRVIKKFSLPFNVGPSNFRCENARDIDECYDFMETIGKGSFGIVRAARERTTGEYRAVKIIDKSKCQATLTLTEEIRILQKLDHPNVVRFFEFFQDSKNYYLVTEYCQGGDLLNKISKQRAFSEKLAARIMKQVFSAVEYCHSNKIVHRDLKLENVVFEGDSMESTVKIIDFGRSRLLQPREKMSDKAGSLYYVAPEILTEQDYNEKCDLWSCGVILYLLIAGHPPFFGDTRDIIIKGITSGTVTYVEPIWQNVSKECRDLVSKLLNPKMKERISASAALKSSWLREFGTPAEISNTDLRNSLNNLKTFRTQLLLQKAVLTYVASRQLPQKMEEKIRKVFNYYDTNKDGQISKEELIAGYKKFYGNTKKAKKEVQHILSQVTLNKNGNIGYNGMNKWKKIIEFLVANLKFKKFLREEKLREIFSFYDKDNNGQITIDELKSVFGTLCSESLIRAIVAEVDLNNDGQISFEEFTIMMEKYVNRSAILQGIRCMSD